MSPVPLDERALLHRANLTRFTHVAWAALCGTGWRFGGTYVAAEGEPVYRIAEEARRISVHDDGVGEGDAEAPAMIARLDRAAAHLVAAIRSVLLADDRLRQAMLREYVEGMIGEGVPGAQVLAVAYDCARSVMGVEGEPGVVAADVAAVCTEATAPAGGLAARLQGDPAARERGAVEVFTRAVARGVREGLPGPEAGEAVPATVEGTARALARELVGRGDGWRNPGRWIRKWVAAPRGGRSPEGR